MLYMYKTVVITTTVRVKLFSTCTCHTPWCKISKGGEGFLKTVHEFIHILTNLSWNKLKILQSIDVQLSLTNCDIKGAVQPLDHSLQWKNGFKQRVNTMFQSVQSRSEPTAHSSDGLCLSSRAGSSCIYADTRSRAAKLFKSFISTKLQ